jgi:hypothetical protein
MKTIRLIASSALIGAAALVSAAAMAAGNNAADAKRAEAANLPTCSSKTTGDCHIHSRETYLQMSPSRPNENNQPHAWWEYDRQQFEARQTMRE